MYEDQFKCPWCSQAFFGNVSYCCNLPKCENCGCRICHSKKTNQKFQTEFSKGIVVCVNCKQPNRQKQEYFFQVHCKKYYCYKCLMIFHENPCKILMQYEQNLGKKYSIKVQLKCDCKVQRKIIVNFLRKFCLICGMKNEGQRCIQLANQFLVMLSCTNALFQDAKNRKYLKQKNNIITELYFTILKEIVNCEDCKTVIEENNIGARINGKFKCYDCLKYNQMTSIHQYEGRISSCNKCNVQFSQHNLSKLCQNCKGKRLYMKKCEKCKISFISTNTVKVFQSKIKVYCQSCNQEELINIQKYPSFTISKSLRKFQKNGRIEYKSPVKFEKILDQKQQKAKNSNEFNVLECKLCFNAESTMMNKSCRHLMMCEQCFKDYSRKHQEARRLACPLCKTLGEYFIYIAPIFS